MFLRLLSDFIYGRKVNESGTNQGLDLPLHGHEKVKAVAQKHYRIATKL